MALPIGGLTSADAVDSTAHIVQVALTPIFLLTGAGTLLNVFNTRLARVSDHTAHAAELLRGDLPDTERRLIEAHQRRLRWRLLALDAAVALAASGGAATCGAAFILFLGSVRDKSLAFWLVILFGVALGTVILALIAFVTDTVLAWHGMRREGPLPHSK